MHEQLSRHLDLLARDACFRVDKVLKDAPYETTECVFFQGANGSELGPFVRKRIDCESGMGLAYESLFEGQRAGKRFLHLPRIYECHRAGDALVVVMECLEGETLADVVQRKGPSVSLAREVFPKLCDAATELHTGFDAPLVHRDLKPSNVMLLGDALTIIDFGITRSFKDGAAEDTRHFGTRSYAPPEQFGFGQTDVRSDVYALGLLLYFCLTGQTPDSAAREAGYANSRIPEALRRIIARAAAFDPRERYVNAAELKRAFLAAMGDEANKDEGSGERVGERVGERAAKETETLPSLARESVEERAAQRRSFDRKFAPFASASVSGEIGKLFSRILPALGVAWDVVLVAVFLLLCLGAVGVTVDPIPTSASYTLPLFRRALVSASIVALIAGPVLFLVADRRPLARLIPRFAEVSFWREAAVCLALFCLGCIIVGVFG